MRVLIPSGEWERTIHAYMRWLGASKQPPTTQKLRSYHLRRFAVETGLCPGDVREDDLLEWLQRPGWSKATARSYRTTFRSFFRWAVRAELIDHDPSADLPVISVAPGVPRPAPEEAVEHGITKARDDRTRLMVRLAAEAGLRCREIALVKVEDVGRDVDGYYLRVHGKGDKERVVPLSDVLAGRILEHRHGYVFPGQIDGHLSAAYVSKLVSRALPEGVTAHPLRHRFASVAYVGTDGDIRAVQELLGHASVATTQIYTKVPDGAKRRGVLAAAW
jgi:integrase